MVQRWIRSLLIGAGEVGLAVVLVLVFFLAFSGILVFSFPRGRGLTDLYGDLVESRRGKPAPQVATLEGEAPLAAVLARAEREVRDRPADAILWRSSRAGMAIENQHAIQTLERSSALIRFDERDDLELQENSLVVIRRPERGRESGRRPALVLLGGRLKGRLRAAPDGAPRMSILAAGAAAEISAAGEAAEFSVTVNDDDSSTVAIYSGSAEIESAGQRRRIEPNQALTIFPDEPPGEPETIPERPTLLGPADGTSETYRSIDPRIVFRWSPAGRGARYRIEIARDPAFVETLYAIDVAAPELVHENLGEGRYYWRVRGLGGGAEGEPSEARSLRIVRDVEPPALTVELPEGEVRSSRVTLRGRTEPGAELLVGGQPVAVGPDGRFEHDLRIAPGLNLIVIEATDPAGNTVYASHHVRAEF